jgi:hypothetical protein
MKAVNISLLMLISSLSFAQQRYTSSNNSTGSWQSAVWTKSASWMQNKPGWNNSPPGGFGYWHEANVYGYLTLTDDMTVANGKTLNVYDTLRITGNLYSYQNINVLAGGILIVEQDLITSGGGVNNIGGTVVVLGNLTASNGGDVNVTGNFYLLGSLTSPGSGERYNGSQTPPSGYFQDESKLDDNPSLYAFAYGGTLPVTFSDLLLRQKERTIEVSWSTLEEENNDFFTIERSSDGLSFLSIGTLAGHQKSNSKQSYVFVDTKPRTGISYYRIRQTDLDGTFTFSDILRYESEESATVSFYPNPASNMIILNVPGNEIFTVRIIDYSGMIKKQYTLNNNGPDLPTIQTTEFERGYYILEITTSTSSIVKRIILK